MTQTLEEKTAIEKYPVYHLAPPDEAFEELREVAINQWNAMPDYPESWTKAEHLPHYMNIGNNFMIILARFDVDKQIEVVKKLSPETKEEIRIRLLDIGEKELAEHIGV